MNRNQKERDAIKRRINDLTIAMENEADQADEIQDNEEWEKANAAIYGKYIVKINDLQKWMIALQYPVVRPGWFADTFCKSFKIGYSHVSEKQANIILPHCDKAYASDYPKCIVNGCLLTLCSADHMILIEKLPDCEIC